MGLFKKVTQKLGDIFGEDIEDEPIKKELTKVEISVPKEEKESFVDADNVRNEEKVKAPVYFDDKDFDTLTPVREKPKLSYGLRETKKEEVKLFKPSPIISPVYGILDKNYHKEDIRNRNAVEPVKQNNNVSIDDVRKKAYGTLEDDIESDLVNTHPVEVVNAKNEIDNDLFDDLDFNLDGFLDSEPRHGKIENEISYVIDIPKIVDIMDDMKEEVVTEETIEKLVEEDKINKDDLFNLIDSMYDDKEN